MNKSEWVQWKINGLCIHTNRPIFNVNCSLHAKCKTQWTSLGTWFVNFEQSMVKTGISLQFECIHVFLCWSFCRLTYFFLVSARMTSDLITLRRSDDDINRPGTHALHAFNNSSSFTILNWMRNSRHTMQPVHFWVNLYPITVSPGRQPQKVEMRWIRLLWTCAPLRNLLLRYWGKWCLMHSYALSLSQVLGKVGFSREISLCCSTAVLLSRCCRVWVSLSCETDWLTCREFWNTHRVYRRIQTDSYTGR